MRRCCSLGRVEGRERLLSFKLCNLHLHVSSWTGGQLEILVGTFEFSISFRRSPGGGGAAGVFCALVEGKHRETGPVLAAVSYGELYIYHLVVFVQVEKCAHSMYALFRAVYIYFSRTCR